MYGLYIGRYYVVYRRLGVGPCFLILGTDHRCSFQRDSSHVISSEGAGKTGPCKALGPTQSTLIAHGWIRVGPLVHYIVHSMYSVHDSKRFSCVSLTKERNRPSHQPTDQPTVHQKLAPSYPPWPQLNTTSPHVKEPQVYIQDRELRKKLKKLRWLVCGALPTLLYFRPARQTIAP